MAKKKSQPTTNQFKYEYLGVVPTALPTIYPTRMIQPGENIKTDVKIENKLFKRIK